MKRLLLAAILTVLAFPASAASEGWVVTTCPATGTLYTIPGYAAISVDVNGNQCISGSISFTPSGTQNVNVSQYNGVALGSPSNYGTSPGAVSVPGVNAFVTNPVGYSSQYPSGATPLTATATGTTAATTATLAGTAGKTTYICGFTISADATTALAAAATVTGTITGSLNFIQNVGAATAAGILIVPFNPCIPASAANTAIAVVSAPAGIAGNTAVNSWGYQL